MSNPSPQGPAPQPPWRFNPPQPPPAQSSAPPLASPFVSPFVQPVTQPTPPPAASRPVPASPAKPQPAPVKPQPAPTEAQPAPAKAGGAARPILVKPQAKAPVEPCIGPLAEPRLEAATVAIPTISDVQETLPSEAPQLVQVAPAFLASMLLHLSIVIALALWYLPSMIERDHVLNMSFAQVEGEQLLDETVLSSPETPAMTLTDFNAGSASLGDPFAGAGADPFAGPDSFATAPSVVVPDVPGVAFGADFRPGDPGMALSGRKGGMKGALLGRYGGTKGTETAVGIGLDWLRRNQLKDGHWSLAGPYSNGSTTENRCAATAMALLAFQGAGQTHVSGDYKQVVQKAWNALLADQDADGDFFRDPQSNVRLYSQAQATIAVCEIYGMTKDEKFRSAAQKAINFAIKHQTRKEPNPGGWKYEPGRDSDLSVTGWFMMALQSARMAELEVPQETLDNISRFLDTVQTDGGSGYVYMPGPKPKTPAMTAEGLLCRQYLGWKREDPRLLAGVEYLAGVPIDYNQQNVYYWYYATQVMHHMGDEPWQNWNEILREVVPKQQILTGTEKGSWNPASDDRGYSGGRLYVTCLSLYMLEVYYRHLPLYRHE